MKTERKKRAQELASDLQRSRAPEVAAIKELVMLQYEEAKESLVEMIGEDVLRKQGGAQALKRLYDMLTRQPLEIKE
jgi:hypothetical protein